MKIWELYQAGDDARAMALFNRMLVPVTRLWGQSDGVYYYVHKTLLQHRGIIEAATVRRDGALRVRGASGQQP